VAIVWWRTPVDSGVWLVAVALSVFVGVVAAGRAERLLGSDDGRIVIDELAGMGLAVLAVPVLVALLLFRALDIGKPPPVRQVEAVAGGWGVMLDDLVAGAGAAALALAGRGLLGSYS
jgi:phosphatidylglycerophosphatase A